MKVVPHRIVRKANPDDIRVILAFDTGSCEPGRKALIERAVTQGDAYVVQQEDVVIAIGVLEYKFFDQGFVSLLSVFWTPGNSKSSKKPFFNPNIMADLDKHYSRL